MDITAIVSALAPIVAPLAASELASLKTELGNWIDRLIQGKTSLEQIAADNETHVADLTADVAEDAKFGRPPSGT